MRISHKKWDTSEHLDSPELIQVYLEAAFETGNTEQILKAVGNVAKAKGMSDIARQTNLGRQNLYKALSAETSPKFETIKKVVEAFGCQLTITVNATS